METKWLRYFILLTAPILSLSPMTFAQDASQEIIQKVVVEVDVPIEAEQIVQAREKAQVAAFRKAVEMTMSETLSPEDRTQRLKNPAGAIKTFRSLGDTSVDGVLKAKFECEVLVGVRQEPQGVGYGVPQFLLELSWNPEKVTTNASNLFEWLASELNVRVSLAKLTRGSLLVTISQTSISRDDLVARVAQHYRNTVSVRSLDAPIHPAPLIVEVPPSTQPVDSSLAPPEPR